ncbi:Threonylcarbamoyl-AMP synthase [Roseivivax jejudonensis]|uniref:Threonylcarbamoyl-AMP synthase n=1 Tax=Roseivivax jejudonensis TaxID=1529041 RepID=A0A1X6ZJY8_9RHOB|nr:L-threonylcarbamoyladenylate synthase [Roseivivax jejudonensis]SLN53091.1 Threonylcarbamoyl-AMP synthase [Roseivivax jejudonensis]
MSQTEELSTSPEDIDRAAAHLRAGRLVAFPTETVYGLGADARDDRAVAGIFEAKARPAFNPLIVHVADRAAAAALVEWSDAAEALAGAFWPGPLTLVLPLRRDAGISKLATAGLDTLAVRMPAHPVARTLLAAFGGPVAAPSANRSGRISPTRAAHVMRDLEGRIAAVVAGGPSEVGLESTILGLSGPPTLLRPGGISAGEISAALGQPVAERAANAAISAPGQTASHYAPVARVRLDATEWRKDEARLGFGRVACDLNLSASGDLREAAANLFAHLHALDESGAPAIAVSPVPRRGLGLAINDRLARAAAPRGPDT